MRLPPPPRNSIHLYPDWGPWVGVLIKVLARYDERKRLLCAQTNRKSFDSTRSFAWLGAADLRPEFLQLGR
jgi:hypothetical protein